MADTVTANYNFVKIEVSSSNNTWGGKLNTNFDSIDTNLKAVSNAAAAAQTTANGKIDFAGIGPAIIAATVKTTLVDADAFVAADTAAANAPKQFTWARLKEGVRVFLFGTDKATPVDADLLAIADSAASFAPKYSTLTQFKAYLSGTFQAASAVLTALAAIGAAAVGDTIVGSGVGTWARQTKGTAGQRHRVNDAGTTILWDDNIQSSAVIDTSTGAVNYDFTGIPAWAKRITICLNDVSYNGSTIGFRLGTASGFVATGYKGTKWDPGGTATSPTMISSSTSSSSDVISGLVTMVRMGTSNIWAFATNIGNTDVRYASLHLGSVDVGGVVDRVQMISFNGTSVGDSGKISIIWE
jgi:hypothetical protein